MSPGWRHALGHENYLLFRRRADIEELPQRRSVVRDPNYVQDQAVRHVEDRHRLRIGHVEAAPGDPVLHRFDDDGVPGRLEEAGQGRNSFPVRAAFVDLRIIARDEVRGALGVEEVPPGQRMHGAAGSDHSGLVVPCVRRGAPASAQPSARSEIVHREVDPLNRAAQHEAARRQHVEALRPVHADRKANSAARFAVRRVRLDPASAAVVHHDVSVGCDRNAVGPQHLAGSVADPRDYASGSRRQGSRCTKTRPGPPATMSAIQSASSAVSARPATCESPPAMSKPSELHTSSTARDRRTDGVADRARNWTAENEGGACTQSRPPAKIDHSRRNGSVRRADGHVVSVGGWTAAWVERLHVGAALPPILRIFSQALAFVVWRHPPGALRRACLRARRKLTPREPGNP